MRILAKPTLIAFYAQATCADSKAPLLSWYGHVLRAPWSGPAALKSDFATAGILKEGRVVFNIGGNKYRLVASINYSYGILYIKFVGTHRQYDAINAQPV